MSEEAQNPFLMKPGSAPPPAETRDAVPLESGTRRIPVSRLPVTAPPTGAPLPPPTTPPLAGPPPPTAPPIPGPPPVQSRPLAPPSTTPPPAPAPVAPPAPGDAAPTGPARVVAAGWTIRLGDAAPTPLVSAVLLGRDPAPRADAPAAALVPVADPDKTVSKTHALLALRDDAVVVTDLSSTNGTTVEDSAGSTGLDAGESRRLSGSATIHLGSFPIRVEPTGPAAPHTAPPSESPATAHDGG